MPEKKTYVWLALAILLQVAGIYSHSLWNPDEPRVAEIAREMAVSGDYVIPHFIGSPFLEKPPLYFTTAGILYRIFGTEHEGVGRFASFIFSAGTLLVVFFATRRLYSQPTAALATLVLASSFKFFESSHKMVVDNALVFFITAALFACILTYRQKLRYGYLIFWGCLAMAFMSKGMIGLAIPGIVVGVFILWNRSFSLLKDMRLLPGILIVAGVMFVWGAMLYTQGGYDFVDRFYFYNQIGRFFNAGGYVGGHIHHFFYYIPTVLADAAPWSLLLIPAFVNIRNADETSRFMFSWLLGGLLLLSISATKRGLYFLPMYPAMAVIVAVWLSELKYRHIQTWEKMFIWLLVAFIFGIGIAAPFAYLKLDGRWWLAGILIMTTTLIFRYFFKHVRSSFAMGIVLCWSLLLLAWSPILFPVIDRQKTYKQFFVSAGEVVADKTVIGYRLTESMEAFSAFYGGFNVVNIENYNFFTQIISGQNRVYVLILPQRLDEQHLTFLRSRGKQLAVKHAKWTREIELWEIGA